MPTCPQCGLGYVPEVPEDRKYHKRFHDEVVNGLRGPRIPSDKIIWASKDKRITVVTHFSSSAQKKRAERIASLGNRETKYDFGFYTAGEPLDQRFIHLFLAYEGSRGIGLLIVEKRREVWYCTWEQYEKHQISKLPDHEPMWSVGFAWVHREYRRRQWGRRLVSEAARFLKIEVDQIGWYTPFSSDGEAMVRAICPRGIYIAK